MWSLQNGFERTLDARINKLSTVTNPDVFLFGSSLMIFPLWFADHGDNLPDSAYYNFQSDALQSKCSEAKKICNMSMALMNASDAERVVDRYFRGSHRPKVLVFGVGPRDFYDSFLASPSASVYFNALSNLDDYTQNSRSYFPNLYDELLNIANRAYFVFGKRAELLSVGKSIIKQSLHLNKPKPIETITDMGVNRNLDEYRGHYKNISLTALNGQFKFLDQLLHVCSQRNIRVILLSMPLTPENRDLLPTNVYDVFNQKLASAASSNGQQFMNLNKGQFANKDFLDSAHLNAKGAHKFIELLAPTIDATLVDARNEESTPH